jgi:predicted secreted protein
MKTFKNQFARNTLTLLLFNGLFLLILFSFSQAEATMIITRQEQEKEIIIQAGTIFQIQLEEKGGTGYTWDFDTLNNEYFELLNVETKSIVRKEGYTANPIIKIWHLKAIKKGPAELTLYYYRPWEDKSKAVDRFHLKFKII